MVFNVVGKVVADEAAPADRVVGDEVTVLGVPDDCSWAALAKLLRGQAESNAVLGRDRRFKVFSGEAMGEQHLRSGLQRIFGPADAVKDITVYLLLQGPREPAAVAVGAGAGTGGSSSTSSAGPFHSLPDGTMPPLFHDTLNSAVIGIYDRRTPVSTAVFFSPTRAITTHHDAKPNVGDILTGASNPSIDPVRKWQFTVVVSSSKIDLVVLEIASGPPASMFLPLGPQHPIAAINSSEVWLASFGISAAKKAAEKPKDIAVGSFTDKTRVSAVGERHFVYHTNTGRGDSGGAIINLAGQLVGVHLGGWNDSSPPPSPETAKGKAGGAKGKAGGAAAAAAAAATAIKNKGRAEAMGMAELGSATIKSIIHLAENISVGGYGIYVCTPAMAAMCSTVLSSSAGAPAAGAGGTSSRGGGGGGGSSLSGHKRYR